MKKIYAFLILALGLSNLHISAQDLGDIEAYEKAIKPGVELTYAVTDKDKHYNLTVTIKKAGDEVAFAWKTSDPDNKSGSVTMSAGAINEAKAFSNIFTGGDAKLDKETSLWVSKQVFNDVSANAQATVKVNGATDTVTVLGNTVGNVNLVLNGEGASVPGYELEGGTAKYTIGFVESVKFPLVYKLDLGWSIVLTEIKNP